VIFSALGRIVPTSISLHAIIHLINLFSIDLRLLSRSNLTSVIILRRLLSILDAFFITSLIRDCDFSQYDTRRFKRKTVNKQFEISLNLIIQL